MARSPYTTLGEGRRNHSEPDVALKPCRRQAGIGLGLGGACDTAPFLSRALLAASRDNHRHGSRLLDPRKIGHARERPHPGIALCPHTAGGGQESIVIHGAGRPENPEISRRHDFSRADEGLDRGHSSLESSTHTPLGGRFQHLSVHGLQRIGETPRSTSRPSRTRRYSRPGVVCNTEAPRNGSVVEVTIFAAAQVAKASESCVQRGAEAKAGSVDRMRFGRVALRPPPHRGALLDDVDPPRPQIRAGRMSFHLNREPVLRHPRISVGGRQPNLPKVHCRPMCKERQTPQLTGQSDTPAFSANHERAESGCPGLCDGRAGIATTIEHNGYPTRDPGRKRVAGRLEGLQRPGEQFFLVVDGEHHANGVV